MSRIDRTRALSLQDIDGEDWGEPTFPSHVVTTVHRLRRVPLKDYSVEDLRLMIGQSMGLPYLVPLAMEHLRANPLVMGDFFPGDLLLNLLHSDPTYWKSEAALKKEVEEIATRLLESLEDVSIPREDPYLSDTAWLRKLIIPKLESFRAIPQLTRKESRQARIGDPQKSHGSRGSKKKR